MYASIRPEDVEIFSEPPQTRENFFKGIVVHMGYLGSFLFSSISLDNTMVWLHMFHHMLDEKGDEIHLFLNPEKCMVLS